MTTNPEEGIIKYIWVSQKFCNILVYICLRSVSHVTEVVQDVVGGIVVVGALEHCSLLYCVCDLKTTQMNEQRSRLQELMLYEFKHRRNNQKHFLYER